MKSELEQFLSKLGTGHEAGCVISNQKGAETLAVLKDSGFKIVHDLAGFFEEVKGDHKVAWDYKGDNFKPVYDLITQYPAGMLEVFDDKLNKTYYHQDPIGPFVLIISDQQIVAADKVGFDVLAKVGSTYRSE